MTEWVVVGLLVGSLVGLLVGSLVAFGGVRLASALLRPEPVTLGEVLAVVLEMALLFVPAAFALWS